MPVLRHRLMDLAELPCCEIKVLLDSHSSWLREALDAAWREGLPKEALPVERFADHMAEIIREAGTPRIKSLPDDATLEDFLLKSRGSDLAWYCACRETRESFKPLFKRINDGALSVLKDWWRDQRDRHQRQDADLSDVDSLTREDPWEQVDLEGCLQKAWSVFYDSYCKPKSDLRFLGQSNLKTFITNIAKNAAREEFKALLPRKPDSRSLPPPGEFGRLLSNWPVLRPVYDGWLHSTRFEKKVLFMYHEDGLPQHEIARRLDLKRASVSRTLNRSWERLVGDFKKLCDWTSKPEQSGEGDSNGKG